MSCICVLPVAVFGVSFRRNTSAGSLALQRFYAMLVKHAVHTWRNRVVTLVQLLLPVIFAILACLGVLTLPSGTDAPPLTLDLSHFDKPTVPFTSANAAGINFCSPQKLARYTKINGAIQLIMRFTEAASAIVGDSS